VKRLAAGLLPAACRGWSPMIYRNTEMKLDQIVNYLNEEKINLSPAFQRGHVWPVKTRRRLIENIVQGRPIPAIFLYKEADGARYSYNILDGKQRIESLILFIGNKRADFAIQNWDRYFFPPSLRKNVDFWIQFGGKKRAFRALEEQVIRDLREYAIPTVEISLTDDSHLDEIISLFVDINQQGVTVSRFDIVKAMGRSNRLLGSVFDLIALKEDRAQDVFYKAKSNDITRVLKALHIISSLADTKAQVDRMWERLIELCIFAQTKQHRKPVDILKSFIRSKDEQFHALKAKDAKTLRKVFRFLAYAYRQYGVSDTPVATDQTYLYDVVTSLIATDLLTRYAESVLAVKLARFGKILDNRQGKPNLIKSQINRYMVLASDRTTDTPRREERQLKFEEIISAL
jgi:Protein of unknown function DUF262